MQAIYKDTKFINDMLFPKFLFPLKISSTAKFVYVTLINKAISSCSKQEMLIDENGEQYIHFTIENLAEVMHKSESTIKSCLNTLRQEGLIKTVQSGAGQPNRIYILMPEEDDKKNTQSH